MLYNIVRCHDRGLDTISILVIIVLPIASYFLVKEVKLDTREESNKQAITKEIKQWKRIEVLKESESYNTWRNCSKQNPE